MYKQSLPLSAEFIKYTFRVCCVNSAVLSYKYYKALIRVEQLASHLTKTGSNHKKIDVTIDNYPPGIH